MYIASAVALADFCHEPTPWVKYALGEQLDYDVSEYYLTCRPGVSNPFGNFLSVSGQFRGVPIGQKRVTILTNEKV